MTARITFRPTTDDDEPFLLELYASTRAEELAQVPWDETQKQLFVRMQFQAQQAHYREHYPTTETNIILVDGKPGGRLYLDRREDEHRLVDITLHPTVRAQGLGTRLLNGILDEARAAGKCVRIHVEHFNPALRLYQRLGFTQIGDTGVYFLMEWRPS